MNKSVSSAATNAEGPTEKRTCLSDHTGGGGKRGGTVRLDNRLKKDTKHKFVQFQTGT